MHAQLKSFRVSFTEFKSGFAISSMTSASSDFLMHKTFNRKIDSNKKLLNFKTAWN